MFGLCAHMLALLMRVLIDSDGPGESGENPNLFKKSQHHPIYLARESEFPTNDHGIHNNR